MATAVWTDAGQALAIDLLDPATRAAISSSFYIAWGSGATAPAIGQTALVGEHPEARVAATVSQPAADTIRYLATIQASAARVVNEAAVFSASAGGTMPFRGTHPTLNIETGDRVEYQFDHVLKDASE